MKYHFQAFRELIPSQEFFAVMDYHLMLYQATSILLSQHLKVSAKLWHTRCVGWDEIKIPCHEYETITQFGKQDKVELGTKSKQSVNQANHFPYTRKFT